MSDQPGAGAAAASLLRALQRQAEQAGLLRLERAVLWRAFATALPVEAAGADARPLLVELLAQLQRVGELKLPRNAQAWDHTARPPFPEWVLLSRRRSPLPPGGSGSAGARPTGPDLLGIPWAPELSFATTLGRTVGEEQYQTLLAAQRFLAEGGRRRPMVPLRERSLHLFGDEKRLERIARTQLFGPGRLSLELLRCYAVAPPLVWMAREGGGERLPQGVLTVENHHTFDSFCRWNRKTNAYEAVIYGAGNLLISAVEYLDKVAAAVGWTGPIDYFGDLDPRGLAIAVEATEAAERDHLLPLRPAARWYALLLQRAEQATTLPAMEPSPLKDRLAGWLPTELRQRVAALFAAGRRAPQELVGWEELQGLEAHQEQTHGQG